MASRIMHDCALPMCTPAGGSVGGRLWEFEFITQILNVGGHREESELSGCAECWLGDWQEGREGYVGKYERV